MSRAGDLRRFLTPWWRYLLDAAVALVLVAASMPAVNAVATRSGLVLVAPGRTVPTETLLHQAVRVWWVFSALLIAGLLVRRRWPLAALIIAGVGAAGHQLDLNQTYLAGGGLAAQPIDLAVLIILFTVAGHARTRRASAIALGTVLVGAYAAACVAVALHRPDASATPGSVPAGGVDQLRWILTQPIASGGREGMALSGQPTVLMGIVVAFVLGDSIRGRRDQVRILQQRAEDLEREQQQRAALATAAERARITRELHDVVAHSLSVMVAQAQAAVAAHQRHPERTSRAMQEVVTVGRASLAEMRRLLGALGPSVAGGREPQPGLGALPALVDRVRATGMPVRLDIRGEPAALPATVDLSAYRIVQEALTNTLKHAGTGVRATVSLDYQAEHIGIEVCDDGAGRPVATPVEHGNGLHGIADRVSLLRGELSIGPAPQRGFLVRARLPLHPDQVGGVQ
ncbi:MAG TPA: histidine kinase [Actinomycetota bacterium]|nr:histidine kinase [Actinomycetota bacterium]